MFEAIVSKVTKVVLNTIRAVGLATRAAPWLITAAILAVFLVW